MYFIIIHNLFHESESKTGKTGLFKTINSTLLIFTCVFHKTCHILLCSINRRSITYLKIRLLCILCIFEKRRSGLPKSDPECLNKRPQRTESF